jgi:hypothetical protein
VGFAKRRAGHLEVLNVDTLDALDPLADELGKNGRRDECREIEFQHRHVLDRAVGREYDITKDRSQVAPNLTVIS